MQTEYRERHVERWYDSQWSFFWTVVGAMLTAGAIATVVGWVLMLIAANYTLKSFDRVISRSLPPVPTVRDEKPGVRVDRLPELGPAFERVEVPAQGHESCLDETGGVVNEQYQKCRRGYTYQRQVR